MRCPECKRDTYPGATNLTFQRKGMTIKVKEIPAEICPSCKEAFIDGPISEYVDELVKEASNMHKPPEILTERGVQVKQIAMAI
ncbi:type II toxin-antitoxin system MqsA family antitoxin [bacterium]|nr:type II toxin-antitoxin system MqsA family antitoxin [bacterium]MBU1614834.1 type II toxin-antitoxin system MqsA family antitoxin [bacterium]